MPYTKAGKNKMLDALAPDKVSLHSAEPSEAGSNELVGGEYARQTIEWNAAAEGTKDDKTNGAVFKVPAASTVEWVGFWKEGTFVAWAKVTKEVFGGAGEYVLTDADINLAFIKE